MDKSAEAFRTISEVAEALDTPAHVLRFWESRFPQIRPVKRAGGRRYYRPVDVALIGGIKHLLHVEGLTIRGVQKILREQGVRHVASLVGHADFGHEDDVDAQLIAAMTEKIGTDQGDEGDTETLNLPSFQAVESAQVVALETALTRRANPEPKRETKYAPILDMSDTPLFSVTARDGQSDARSTNDASLETLAAALRTLPRPIPIALAQRLLPLSNQLESLRDRMQDHPVETSP